MGKLLWGSSLAGTTGCCQYVPVAILSRYTEKEMISAVMTKAAHEEPVSLPATVRAALTACRRVGMGLKPSCSFPPVGWGWSTASASAGESYRDAGCGRVKRCKARAAPGKSCSVLLFTMQTDQRKERRSFHWGAATEQL